MTMTTNRFQVQPFLFAGLPEQISTAHMCDLWKGKTHIPCASRWFAYMQSIIYDYFIRELVVYARWSRYLRCTKLVISNIEQICLIHRLCAWIQLNICPYWLIETFGKHCNIQLNKNFKLKVVWITTRGFRVIFFHFYVIVPHSAKINSRSFKNKFITTRLLLQLLFFY